MNRSWGRSLSAYRKRLELGVVSVKGYISRFLPTIRRRWHGRDPNDQSNKHAIYVHYDESGKIDEFVKFHLNAISQLGFRLTFVSNSPRLDEQDVSLIQNVCREILLRRNIGYDFGAYSEGVRAIGNLDKVQSLILANDSVYGPLFPLAKYINNFDPRVFDIWAMTDSREITYHLQSYFLLVHKSAIDSKAFRAFWRKYPYVNGKQWVVRLGEIGFSQKMQSSGLRLGAHFSCQDAESRRSGVIAQLAHYSDEPAIAEFLQRLKNPERNADTYNPTHYYWDHLIRSEKYPYIKRDLVRNNPANIPTALNWEYLLDAYTNYDSSIITHHLGQSKK